jgi:hypothetical protein
VAPFCPPKWRTFSPPSTLSEGVPIPTVSKRLGHANPSITLKLYSHALESDELAAVKRWDDAFADVIGQAHDNRTPATKNMSVAPIGSCRKDSDNSVTDLSVNVNE